MKRIACRVLAGLLTACCLLSAGAAVEMFPVPNGLEASPHYQLEVETDDGWKPSHVYFNPSRKDGAGAGDQPGRSMSWTTFHADAAVRVRVTATTGSADGAKIRPSRLGIVAQKVSERSVEFSLAPGQKVSVEFEHAMRQTCFTGLPCGIPCVMHGLLVFADRVPTRNPLADHAQRDIARIAPGLHAELRPVGGLPGRSAHASTLGNAGGKRIVYFEPGVHDIGYWQIPNNVDHVHLAPGAVVFGALDILPLGCEPGAFDMDVVYRDAWERQTLRKEFLLTGAGILSGAKLPWHLKKDFTYHSNDHWWQHVKLVQLAVESIAVRDVTLVDSPYWVMSLLNDADARTRGRFENFKMVGAWTYNNDGLPVPGGGNSIVRDAFIHADDDALKLYHSGARVENCVVWQGNNGAVFQFGWFPKTVRDVRVRDVDVIHNENWYGVGQANRATFNYADSGGAGLIEDVHFENVTIEGRILRLFGFKAGRGQKIRDFHFQNLRVGGLGAGYLGSPGRNYFIGDISGFHFDSFTVGNELVTKPELAWLEFASQAGGEFTFSGRPAETLPGLSSPPPKPAEPSVSSRPKPANVTAGAVPGGEQLLANPKFADGAKAWTHAGVPTRLADTDDGTAPVVPARQHIQQDVTDALRQQGPGIYTYAASVRAVSGDAAVKVTLRIEDDLGAQQHPSPDVTATSMAWEEATRTQPIQWSNLRRATLLVESGGARPADFLVRVVWLTTQPE